MANFEASFSGLDELIGRIDRISRLEDAKKFVQLHTARLAALTTTGVPVVTGNLKRSMMVLMSPDGLTGQVVYTADYAYYVEFGTRWFIGRRFIGAPFTVEKVKFLADMRRLVS